MPSWKKVIVSGSDASLNTLTVTNGITGSLQGTASYAINADFLDGKDSSVFATTGSNIFVGNQTVTGSLFTTGSNTLVGSTSLTGSLNITGSTTQIGSNTLLGNTTLSGSIIISGALGTNDPTVKIYGDTTHNGYIRFDPVSTNINTAISASYIYVSGSTNDLYFSQNGSGYSNVTRLRWLEGNLYTGLLHGGLITTQSSTVYQISSGSGIIVDLNASLNDDPYPTIQYLNWPNLSASIAPLTASYQQAFVGIDSTNNIFQQGTPFSNGQFDVIINIGNVLFQNQSTINGVKTQPSVAYGFEQAQNVFNRAFGPLKLSGYTLAPSGSSTGSLIVGSGTAYAPGSNYAVDPNEPYYTVDSGTNISKIFRYHQSGSTWVYNTNAGAGFATIDPGQYSNNGTLTTVQPNDWSIQRVFWFPNSVTKAIVVYYGNASYSTKADAIANINIESFVEAPNTAANAIYLGSIVIRGNGLLTVPADFTIVPGGLFRQVGGSGGGGSIITQTLSGLSDVNISGPTDGQALVYNTTQAKWINSSAISASITGNAATATSASFATTASYVLNAVSASYADNATSASFATTASYVLNAVSASFATNALSSSYAITSSHALNANTASYVLNAVSASFATSSSFAQNAISASYAVTASILRNDTAKVSASTAVYTSGSSLLYDLSEFKGAMVDYVVSTSGSGTNARAGTFTAVWNSVFSSFNESTTMDIGNTDAVHFSADSTGSIFINVTTGSWEVDSLYRALGKSITSTPSPTTSITVNFYSTGTDPSLVALTCASTSSYSVQIFGDPGNDSPTFCGPDEILAIDITNILAGGHSIPIGSTFYLASGGQVRTWIRQFDNNLAYWYLDSCQACPATTTTTTTTTVGPCSLTIYFDNSQSPGTNGWDSSTEACQDNGTPLTVYFSNSGGCPTTFNEAFSDGKAIYTDLGLTTILAGNDKWFKDTPSSDSGQSIQVGNDGFINQITSCATTTTTTTTTSAPTTTTTTSSPPPPTTTTSTTTSTTTTTTIAPNLFTHGTVIATCSDYCNSNYNITTATVADNDYASLAIGDVIYGQGGIAGYVAYSNISTDTTTGPFKVAQIDSSGEIIGITECSGGSCVPV
jgi:hypothetical protein